MFSTYSAQCMGMLRGFENDMVAIDLKEDAQRLQGDGHFERALPLMLRSVEMRETSHTICLSLSELAELYLDMLKLKEAEETCHRMLREAHRYDSTQQTRIAQEILADAMKAKAMKLSYGSRVQVCDLVAQTNMNGKIAHVRGWRRSDKRYYVDVCNKRVLVKRANFQVTDGEAGMHTSIGVGEGDTPPPTKTKSAPGAATLAAPTLAEPTLAAPSPKETPATIVEQSAAHESEQDASELITSHILSPPQKDRGEFENIAEKFAEQNKAATNARKAKGQGGIFGPALQPPEAVAFTLALEPMNEKVNRKQARRREKRQKEKRREETHDEKRNTRETATLPRGTRGWENATHIEETACPQKPPAKPQTPVDEAARNGEAEEREVARALFK